jgi:hypothetical protein
LRVFFLGCAPIGKAITLLIQLHGGQALAIWLHSLSLFGGILDGQQKKENAACADDWLIHICLYSQARHTARQ